MGALHLVSFRVAAVWTVLLNFHWLLCGGVAVCFGVPGLSGMDHFPSCLWFILFGDGGLLRTPCIVYGF